MILVDTSVWIDHLRYGNDELARTLNAGSVAIHPYVVAEIALGTLRARKRLLSDLKSLPSAPTATHEEVLHLIERVPLSGRGIGYVDAHLLASTRLMTKTRLWTRDKRLLEVAKLLKIAYAAA